MRPAYIAIPMALVAFPFGIFSLAGGAPGLQFSEVAQAAGIHAEMRCGGPEKRWIPEANGSGVAWLDYDNDGLMDLLIVNGGSMDQLRRTVSGGSMSPAKNGVYLFHNLGNGHFEDVTARAGLTNPYWGTGANAADYNNDGYTDILITTIGVDLLYKNNGDGTFTEVGAAAGLSRDVRWHTGSTFGDFDNDGYLDIYVAGYVDIHSISLAEPAPVCPYKGMGAFCGPIGMKAERGILYRNNANGTFTDVTKNAGLNDVKPAHGFSAVLDDFNNDGKIDLFVANDSDPNSLFLNQGDGTFKESALSLGVGFNADGHVQSNMGIAIENSENGGRLNLLTTTFIDDYFPLFKQDKAGFFEDASSSNGLTMLTRKYLGWACGFADFDNDARRELWLANGHVYPRSPYYLEPVSILANHHGQFSAAYQYPETPNNSYRGGAHGDFNNDGRVDLLILPIAGQPLLLQNTTATSSSWIGVQLRGTSTNRDAIGARIEIGYCGQSQFATLRNGGSYLSRNDPRAHFGLGDCAKVDRVAIKWPRGAVQKLTGLPLNRYTTIEEPR